MIAHVIGGGPVWVVWITAALLFGGGVAAMAVPRERRWPYLAMAAVGLVGTVAAYALFPAAPQAPVGLSLTIASPVDGATVGNPVVVRACAAGFAVPGTGRLLSISIDGRQVGETRTDVAAVTVAEGRHTLRVELLTLDHREFAPTLLTDETLTVSGVTAPAVPPRCPT
ncbi:MAG: hypothetical protein M3R48_10340 [Candidatus Dormibacteraeota bacterium]|nr:hypothetical protein [Candidatus Dormibacteraeota bacterium]